MKYFVISQPKAGTHLCGNLLREFGLDFNGRQLSNIAMYDYSGKNMEKGRKDPTSVKKKMKFKQGINLIKENEVAIGHIEHSAEKEKLLKDFKKVLMLRDLESTLESWNRWASASGRKSDPGKHATQEFRNSIQRWESVPNVFTMNFYDIKDINVEKIDELQIYLFDEVKFDSVDCAKRAIEKPSTTKV